MSSVEELLETIDQQIEEIESHKTVKKAMAMLEERDKLRAARRALLGTGPKLTSGDSGKRLTQAEVVQWMRDHGEPGSTFSLQELSQGLGFSSEVVRGHLNRGNNERFLKDPRDGEWGLRDPENGYNKPEDLGRESDA